MATLEETRQRLQESFARTGLSPEGARIAAQGREAYGRPARREPAYYLDGTTGRRFDAHGRTIDLAEVNRAREASTHGEPMSAARPVQLQETATDSVFDQVVRVFERGGLSHDGAVAAARGRQGR